jgi:type III restriction enzyme
MSESFEVAEPILNGPFSEPAHHWLIRPGTMPVKAEGRREAGYWFRAPGKDDAEEGLHGEWVPLTLVNLIRARLADWRRQGRPGVTRTTHELLSYWEREGRHPRLFFTQREAAETIIFLKEARADFLQGIEVPRDEPSADKKAEGYKGFLRYACKMATGSGKTTVMAMLAAWSILNKVNDRGDGRFSDTVLVVCPNVTIRNRLAELDPELGETSLYRTRDLVPERLMPDLRKGRVLVTNWHAFEPQGMKIGGVSAKVAKVGKRILIKETMRLGAKTTTQRGYRYITQAELDRQANAGLLKIVAEHRDRQGALERVEIEAERWIESDTALVNRVIGRAVGGKQNILVLNDEAHHAYRIWQDDKEDESEDEEERDDDEYFVKEATVWIDGLDRIDRLRGINLCVDLSATPYFISRGGPNTNRVFPWVVSDFGLTDAIESGLVKIPQLAVRDTSGTEIPGYFNIWKWVLPKLSSAERGNRTGSPKPEAILKHAQAPIAMLGGLWEQKREEWAARPDEPRPPVFILVCKNTRIAKVVHEWLAEDKPPAGVPSANLPGLRNGDGAVVTIRVDTKVVQESDSDTAKSDDVQWMRMVLDTVGRRDWPRDGQGRAIYPPGFEALATKLKRPMHPPGRDVRCIVSVGMLTEGWDCNTVTHIVGLRPFMSQLLCEQVVGRGLRRANYDVRDDGKLTEEVAKVFGVPFAVVPFKGNPNGGDPPPPKPRIQVHALAERASYAISFPRVESYRQSIRHRIKVDWPKVAPLELDIGKVPPNVEVKPFLPSLSGPMSAYGPGIAELVDLNPLRKLVRPQRALFQAARDLTRRYAEHDGTKAPAHVLFPQMVQVIEHYLRHKVIVGYGFENTDALLLSPFYTWMLERITAAIGPDDDAGEPPELPNTERNRGDGSTADVNFWTSRPVREVVKSHVNYVVADTRVWEQSAAYLLDQHPAVVAFVKNAGLGFAIPYLHDGQPHDYEPDFITRLASGRHLILETKGHDPLADVKRQAAERWVAAVNADGRWGTWSYAVARSVSAVGAEVNRAAKI